MSETVTGPFPLQSQSTTPPAMPSIPARPLRVMVACEYSGVVRDAFLAAGHDAISCDLLPTESPGPHLQADILEVDLTPYDLLIAHPPCTYLSAARHDPAGLRSPEIDAALALILYLMTAPVPRIAIENPVGKINSRIRRPDQITDPSHFGSLRRKRTCWWLKNLPPLMASYVVPHPDGSWYSNLSKKRRGLERSRFWPGMAAAMADQWGRCG